MVKKGQSISHIYANHADEIKCSRKTLYTYIEKSVFSVGNIDLRRRVKYKPRKSPAKSSIVNRRFRINRTYDDLQKYLKSHSDNSIVEMDTVMGKKETRKVLLTFMFRSCSLMLIFLLDENTQEEVQRVFDFLSNSLGIE